MSDLLDHATEAAKRSKEQLVADSGRADLMPMLDIRLANGESIVALLAVDVHPTDAIVPAAFGLFDHGHDRFERITLIVESYMLTAPAGSSKKDMDMPRGTLAARFAKGDPAVTECVTIYARDAKGNTEAAMIPFTYEGKHTVVWGEATSADDTMTGAVPDALRFVMNALGAK